MKTYGMASFARRRQLTKTAVGMIVGLVLCNAAVGLTILAPNTPHNGGNAFPFGPWYGNEIPNRYQQIWDASLFPGPIDIVSLAFSPLYAGEYSANVTIRLTQTSTAVNGLSSPLDSNISGSLTTVFSDPNFSRTISVTGSESFSFDFDFSSTPFSYDPTGGENLLMDVLIDSIVYDQVSFGAFSFAEYNSGTSRIYQRPSGGVSGGASGLRAQIGYSSASVPDPGSTLVLLGCALVGVGGLRRRLAESADTILNRRRDGHGFRLFFLPP